MINIFKKISQYLKNEIGKDSLELLSHAKNYLGAKIIIAALSFLAIPILTRLLPPDQYGTLAIFTSFVAIFNIIFGLSLRGSIKVNYIKKDYPHQEYLFTNIIFLLGSNVILFSIIYLFKDLIAVAFSFSSYLIVIASITAIGNIYVNVRFSLLQAKKKSKLYSIIATIQQSSIIIISLLAIYLLVKYLITEDVYLGQVYTTLIITLLFSIYSLFYLFRESSSSFHWKYIKDSLKFGLPLVPDGLVIFILAFFDRIIINQIVGMTKAGIYSLAYQVGAIMQAVTLSMNMAWQPIYWENIKAKNWKTINRTAHKYGKYVFIIAIGLMLFSKELVLIVAAPEYREAMSLVPIIVLSYVFFFLYTLFVGIEFYKKKTWLVLINNSIAAGLNIILNYLLIPKYGYQIAAWTTLASYALMFVLHYLSSRFILKYDKLKLGSILPDFFYLVGIFILIIIFMPIDINIGLSILIKLILFAFSAIYLFKRYYFSRIFSSLKS